MYHSDRLVVGPLDHIREENRSLRKRFGRCRDGDSRRILRIGQYFGASRTAVDEMVDTLDDLFDSSSWIYSVQRYCRSNRPE
jgi:hypothetical protein